MSMYSCYGFGMEFRERRALLEAVYQRYRVASNQSEAAAQLQMIDALLPAPITSRQNMDFAAIDALRKQLGLKPHLNP